MLRGAIGGELRACPPELATKVGGLLRRDDDDRASGKPTCDGTDRAAREALVTRWCATPTGPLRLAGERLDGRVADAAALLAP